MNKYKEKSRISHRKDFILNLLSQNPKSAKEILQEVDDHHLNLFLSCFSELQKEGLIVMVGFFPCRYSRKVTPYYLSYSNPLHIDHFLNSPHNE